MDMIFDPNMTNITIVVVVDDHKSDYLFPFSPQLFEYMLYFREMLD